MATITIRVDEQTKADLEVLADGRGQNVSDVLRAAVEDLLGRDERPSVDMTPVSIPVVQRQQLALLHRILARLMDPSVLGDGTDGDADYQYGRAMVLEAGYVQEYSTEFAGIDPELSLAESKLVMDLMDMFAIIQSGLTVHESDPRLDDATSRALRFAGFDANDPAESRLLYYARYLIAEGKWADHAELFSLKHDRGNSHMPLLGGYRRILRAFGPIRTALVRDRGRDAFQLTPEELNELAAAARQPAKRDW